MGVSSSLLALADVIDPRLAYWEVELRSGKVWKEHQLVTTWKSGERGIRKLDWGEDLVTTGDVHRVKELRLHCPDGRVAVLEIGDGNEPFQLKGASLDMLGSNGLGQEFICIGRILDKETGRAECFIWDYRPEPGQPNLIAYKTNINNFGTWRASLLPIGPLSSQVQGFRL